MEIAAAQSLTADERRAIEAIADEATLADHTAPLSEDATLRLRASGTHLVARDGGAVVGYAGVHDDTAELFVAPSARGHGVGTALFEALPSLGELRFWAHGGHPAAAKIAAAHDFSLVRELRLMSVSLNAPLPDAEIPEGIAVRTFRPGLDEDAWLAVNARAFAHHPEQGRWQRSDLDARIAEPWFDPSGFFLAHRVGDVDDVVGFHWTKVHTPPHSYGDAPVGEVYVVGVDPSAQAHGLGRALTLVGLHHLHDAGLSSVILYVDADNTAAVRLYGRLGFTVRAKDLMYARVI